MEMLLKQIKIDEQGGDEYPFNLPLFSKGLSLMLTSPITFIVGENGSGKSTLLESLAHAVGFNTLGGNKNHIYTAGQTDDLKLADVMHLVWSVKQTQGVFLGLKPFLNLLKTSTILRAIIAAAFITHTAENRFNCSHTASLLWRFLKIKLSAAFIF